MKIKTSKHITYNDKDYYTLQGYENEERIFACDANVSWDSSSEKYTFSFGSCNGEIDFMNKRMQVINKARLLANKLNK